MIRSSSPWAWNLIGLDSTSSRRRCWVRCTLIGTDPNDPWLRCDTAGSSENSSRAPAMGGGGSPTLTARSYGRSGPGVSLFESGPEAFGGDMGVDLRAGQRGVPEQILYGPQVGAAVEQMGGRRVAQVVRAGVREAGGAGGGGH